MSRGKDIIISSRVYIDWALYFTIIALIVFWITDRLMYLLLEYDAEIKKAINQLYINSIADPLTGLYKRHYLNKISKEIINDRRAENHLAAAIMVDIDYFKNYNDYYGHVAGDQCLMAVASVLRRSLYRSDDKVFRIGGEEFLILISEIDSDGLDDIISRIHKQLLKENIEHKNSEVSSRVTISMGAILFDTRNKNSLDDLMKAADSALYRAKEDGRNKAVKDILI